MTTPTQQKIESYFHDRVKHRYAEDTKCYIATLLTVITMLQIRDIEKQMQFVNEACDSLKSIIKETLEDNDWQKVSKKSANMWSKEIDDAVKEFTSRDE